jgi:hypothetical protein
MSVNHVDFCGTNAEREKWFPKSNSGETHGTAPYRTRVARYRTSAYR